MQKRSHLLLARSILSRENGFPARRYELAFLFGSFQPDCNPFSYLKGSLHSKPFGGHTYGNAKAYINRRIRRLQRRARWNLWHYYTMGKLTHYVADAFTWPHNPHFPGVGWEHHVYETALRLSLHAYLSGAALPGVPCPDVPATLPQELEALHNRYLSEKTPGPDVDIAYILQASAMLLAGCRPMTGTGYPVLREEVENFA